MAGDEEAGGPLRPRPADPADAPGDPPPTERALAKGEPLGEDLGPAGGSPFEGVGLDRHRKQNSCQAAVIAHGGRL